MKKLLPILCLVLLSSCSQEVVINENETVTRDDITYHQDTNELVTGIVESFYDDGSLSSRTNYTDGKMNGLMEVWDENGVLRGTRIWENGVGGEMNFNP